MLKRIAITLMLALVFGFTTATSAHALIQITGNYLIDAEGGAVDGFSDGELGEFGHMAVTGWFSANSNGTASKVLITIAYEDSGFPFDGITCHLTTPSDLTFTISPVTGNGTLTLTLSSSDQCFETADHSITATEPGAQLTFNLTDTSTGKIRISSNQTPSKPLFDADDEPIAPIALSGKVQRAGAFGSAIAGTTALGTRIMLAGGGASDCFDCLEPWVTLSLGGHMNLAGNAVLNTWGGASSLNMTLNYQDNDPIDGFYCRLRNPKDLSYSLSPTGAGSLSLTLSSCYNGDCCFTTLGSYPIYFNAGKSITFDLYSGGNTARILSVASDLEDANYDVIVDPAVIGEFDAAAASD